MYNEYSYYLVGDVGVKYLYAYLSVPPKHIRNTYITFSTYALHRQATTKRMREELTTFLTFLFLSLHDHRHHNYYHRCLVSSSASLATQSHHRATSPANSVDRAKALQGCKNREEKWTTFAFNQCISASITILPTTMYYEWTRSKQQVFSFVELLHVCYFTQRTGFSFFDDNKCSFPFRC